MEEIDIKELSANLVREAAKEYLYADESEKAAALERYLKLVDARNALTKHEHDYNDPARERKERIKEYLTTIIPTLTSCLTYAGLALVATYCELSGDLEPSVVEDIRRKFKLK